VITTAIGCDSAVDAEYSAVKKYRSPNTTGRGN